MAAYAIIFYRFMNKSGLVQHRFHIFVASQAEILAGPDEAIRRIGSDITMTEHTCGGCHRSMDILVLFEPLSMAFSCYARLCFLYWIVEDMELFVLGKTVNNYWGL
jgi:hypothetical protein